MNSSPPGARPLHILHLEDYATDRALIHEALWNGGLRCEIRHAATRTEFEAALVAASYDLIISDFTLPAYDGAAALALAQRVRLDVPFLFVSGTIGEERAVESLQSGATGPHVCLRMRDTGCGMPTETRECLFEPFFTIKDVGKGTGLGLSTVFGIVKHHQGWIEVDSTVGEGTEFRAYFPAATTELTAGPAESGPDGVPGGRETILLVEDEVPVRELAKLVLQEYGYRVLSAGSGVQALEVWRWHADRIALLLTDLVMPDDMTGIELAEKLRAEKPTLQVVYTSGYSSETGKPGFAALHGSNFLHKPYQPSALAHIVRAALDREKGPPAV